MSNVVAEILSAVLLVCVLVFAIRRPHGVPEAVVAVPAAGVLLLTGAVTPADAAAEVQRLLPVVGFLMAVLALAHLCAAEGVFEAAGAVLARRCTGRPGLLLVGVFVLAAVVTAVLSLDATVVLLTPVVLVTARHAGASARPHVYACAHLANSASLLLPVSNLTNLLALSSAGLSFTRFAALMTLPWLAALGVEYVVFRRFFAAELTPVDDPAELTRVARPQLPAFALWVLVLTLAGFVVASLAGTSPAWPALAGSLVLAARALRRGETTAGAVVRAANIPFAAFVLALGVVVEALVDHGLKDTVASWLPGGSSLPALLAVAAFAALLANVINNLPAVLALLPVVAHGGAGPVLAVLIGVNVGPNLTYTGSLATLLWRRVLLAQGLPPRWKAFVQLGVVTVPATILACVAALWASLRLLGT
ncbi:SLC13 family permease [Streptomyces sp. NPDC059740]|uniref:SLC13 family permease n=1 Tax=Streptomyces sp. NPDC059740 TaxID=3346926 RepID=UPI003666AA32